MNKEEHDNDSILYSIILVTEKQTTESFYRNQYPRSELNTVPASVHLALQR